MRNFITKIFVLATSALLVVLTQNALGKNDQITGAPPYGEPESEAPLSGSLEWFNSWKRPDGPPKVALQVGHWKSDEIPDEQKKLRGNTGSSGGGKWEWEVNLAIAQEVEKILNANDKGVVVEILPASVPPSYWADVFLAIHADGSEDPSKRGYKVASPWRDYTHNSSSLVANIEGSYEEIVGFEKDDNITRNMRGYYAFSWWRYEHAIHPMTTAAIIEVGFLTNRNDQKLLINSPEIPAQGIAEGVIIYLDEQNLLGGS